MGPPPVHRLENRLFDHRATVRRRKLERVHGKSDCIPNADWTGSYASGMKWIVCPGCSTRTFVHDSALSCSHKCRNRVWRRRHGINGQRAAFCAWCQAPLLYMPQDRLPGTRQFCDHQCARRAWSYERAKKRTTLTKALEIAVRRLECSRTPRIRAAAVVLAQLGDELTQGGEAERAARIEAFLSKVSVIGSGAENRAPTSPAGTTFLELCAETIGGGRNAPEAHKNPTAQLRLRTLRTEDRLRSTY